MFCVSSVFLSVFYFAHISYCIVQLRQLTCCLEEGLKKLPVFIARLKLKLLIKFTHSTNVLCNVPSLTLTGHLLTECNFH